MGFIFLLKFSINLRRCLIYILLSYLPFYLFLRFSLNAFPIFIVLQDAIVFLILIISVMKISITGQYKFRMNSIDKAVGCIIIYTIMLIFFSVVRGGYSYALQHSHNYLFGLLIYIVVRRFISYDNIKIILNLFGFLAVVVSIIFLIEWYLSNIVKSIPGFGWMLQYQELSGGTDITAFRSALDEDGTLRVAGIFGHLHATAAFVAGGAIMFITNIMTQKGGAFWNWSGGIVCLIALFVSTARTAIGAFLVVLLILLYLLNRFGQVRLKLSGIIKVSTIVIILGFIIANFIVYQSYSYYFTMYANFLSNKTLIAFSNIFRDVFTTFYRKVADNPSALFTGFGFYFSADSNYNPVMTDDLFFLQLFSEYGLMGSLLFAWIAVATYKYLVSTLRRNKRKPTLYSNLILSPFCVVSLFVLTIVHSGVIRYYGIFYWLFSMLAVVSVIYEAVRRNDNLYLEEMVYRSSSDCDLHG